MVDGINIEVLSHVENAVPAGGANQINGIVVAVSTADDD